MKRNAIYYFYQNLFLLVILTCWKRNTFQISMKFHLKKRKIIFKTLFSPSIDLLHSSPIVYMDHTELIIQDLLLYCTKKVAENHNKFFHFHHEGETHFLVLAETYIILWYLFCIQSTMYYALLCHAMPWYAMPWYAMPCTMPCTMSCTMYCAAPSGDGN